MAAAESAEVFAGLRLPVARLGHLLAMKILSRDDKNRPQDRVDIVALLASASPEEINVARSALEAITQRGFQRRKALIPDLEHFLKSR